MDIHWNEWSSCRFANSKISRSRKACQMNETDCELVKEKDCELWMIGKFLSVEYCEEQKKPSQRVCKPYSFSCCVVFGISMCQFVSSNGFYLR